MIRVLQTVKLSRDGMHIAQSPLLRLVVEQVVAQQIYNKSAYGVCAYFMSISQTEHMGSRTQL